ncbi:MAG: hypothetical protein Q4D29_10790, partial [Lachnospiraceae bacterium]|nr:hypothetical protein [Lachnospiraceae bacterium]
MKCFTRKISAVLIAILLFMTVAPNLAYANDDIDFSAQNETVVEETSVTENTPEPEQAPVVESTPEPEQA